MLCLFKSIYTPMGINTSIILDIFIAIFVGNNIHPILFNPIKLSDRCKVFTPIARIRYFISFHDSMQRIPLTISITGSNGSWTIEKPINNSLM